MPRIVTAYEHPDLDGVGCAYAYAEFLRAKGGEAVAVTFGTPQAEAQYVLDKLGVTLPAGSVGPKAHIILVDASDTAGIARSIDPANVIEIIDHRRMHEAHRFVNAKIQIEQVGAAATLIAEKFISNNLLPSHNAATMLLAAIISNTINFQANVTTTRDREAATWLESLVPWTKEQTREMFAYKSRLEGPFSRIVEQYIATPVLGKHRAAIIQLELVDAQEILAARENEIRETLEALRQQYDLVFLTCIDVERGNNVFMAPDAFSREILQEVLEVTFTNDKAFRQGILMRKEIIPKLNDVLVHKS